MIAHCTTNGDEASLVGLQLRREGDEEQFPDDPGVQCKQRDRACGHARLTVYRQSVIIAVGQPFLAAAGLPAGIRLWWNSGKDRLLIGPEVTCPTVMVRWVL